MKSTDPLRPSDELNYFSHVWTYPLLFISFSSVVLLILYSFHSLADRHEFESDAVNIDENLPNYFDSLKPEMAAFTWKKCENMKKNYMMEI